MMSSVQSVLNEVTRQSNTRAFLDESIQRLDLEQMRLITDNTFNIDKVRIESVKDFLIIQRDEVQATIDELLNSGVSGV